MDYAPDDVSWMAKQAGTKQEYVKSMYVVSCSEKCVKCELMIKFYKESDVSETDNRRLMELQQLCFPMLECFKTRRYYVESPEFRWFIRNDDKIIANSVVHDKIFMSDKENFKIAGVAIVCVHPKLRNKGLAKKLLSEIHKWAKDKDYSFLFLFGKNEIYQSSGYIQCNNIFKFIDHWNKTEEIKQIDTAHYVSINHKSWPKSLIDIQGPMF